LKNCLITLQQYAWKGNQEENRKKKKAISPMAAQIKFPFNSLLVAFLK
jgi:hypothetical protein